MISIAGGICESSCRKFHYEFLASPRDRESENRKAGEGGSKGHYTYYEGRGRQKFYCSEDSQALPARPSRKGMLVQGKTLGKEEGKVMARELLGICSKREKLGISDEFVFGGQHFDESLVMFGGLLLAKNFKLILKRAA
jgi:hypothetical protein